MGMHFNTNEPTTFKPKTGLKVTFLFYLTIVMTTFTKENHDEKVRLIN